MCYAKDGDVKVASIYLRETRIWDEIYGVDETKIIYLGGKFRHILNSSENAFYFTMLVNGLR